MTDKSTAELDRLFPGASYTTQNGEEIAVRPITFGKLKVFVTAISSLMSKAAAAGIDNIEDSSQWPVLFEVAYDEVAKLLIAILNDAKYGMEWLEDTPAADVIGIFAIILAQNTNDITKKNIQALVEAVKSAMPASPSSSSDTDIPGEASKS